LRERRATVFDEQPDDPVVDTVGHVRNHSRSVPGIASRTRPWDHSPMTVIGVPTEIKLDEHRVGLTPAGVRELTGRGHTVLVQAGAGEASAITDTDCTDQGATIVADADAVFAGADLVVKVKEPQPVEV